MCFDATKQEIGSLTDAGPGYRSDTVFDLSRMQPYTLSDLVMPFRAYTKDIVLYLPRSSDLRQLVAQIEGDQKLDITHYCMEGASKVHLTLGYLALWLKGD